MSKKGRNQMKCDGCGNPKAVRVINYGGVEVCEKCGGCRATGGTSRDGIMSRQSLRVRTDSHKNEVDTLPPHRFDKASREWVANEDFVKNNPETVHNFLDDDELSKAGFSKLAKGKNGNKKN